MPTTDADTATDTDTDTDSAAAAFTFARLHHVQLSIPPGGEEKSRTFWAGPLGMRELAKPPVLAARGGCWFHGGGIDVHCGVEAEFAPARKAHPGLLVTGTDSGQYSLRRASAVCMMGSCPPPEDPPARQPTRARRRSTTGT